jgi:alpha-amylase
VLFQAVHDGTAFGDSMVVVGNRPELGGWSPQSGIPLETTDTLFPSWSGNVKLPAGTAIEFKFVTIRANGAIVWEPGTNRVLTIGDDGRSEVYGGTYGDTSDAWTPAAP